ncbi:MAG: HD domain-containing protein [archaeon]
MDVERIGKMMDFLREVDKLKSVYRKHELTDYSRAESDTDHSWHMGLFAMTLHGDLESEVDLLHSLKMIVVHDLVEVVAGDTYAYDEEGKVGQAQREEAAAHKLYSILPEDLYSEFYILWREFESGTSAEASYARSMDTLQALAQNYFTGGRIWRENGITEAMSRERCHEGINFDETLNQVFELLYERAKGMWGED